MRRTIVQSGSNRRRFFEKCRAVALLLGLMSLPACEAPQPAEADPPSDEPVGPNVSVIGSRFGTRPEEKPFGTVRLFAYMVRLEVPLHESTEPAWQLVDEAQTGFASTKAWQSNGLRAGILEMDDLARFENALPQLKRANRLRIISRYDRPYAIHASPPLMAPIAVDLTVPPFVPSKMTATRGRMQLLARLVRVSEESTLLELLPHHHLPRQTIEPRAEFETALDGRIFDELSLNMPVREDALIVIGLYRKPPAKPNHDEPSSPGEAPAGTTPADPPPADRRPPIRTTLPSLPPLPDDRPKPPSETESSSSPVDRQSDASDDADAHETTDGDSSSPEENTTDNPANDDADSTTATTPPAQPDVDLAQLPNHLGRQMFSGRRGEQEVQVILMLRVDMLESGIRPRRDETE